MSNQENNELSKLPIAPLIKPDITEGIIPLPPTALLSAAERARLDELAKSPPIPGETPESFQVFEDGSCFKYVLRPGFAGQCILVDATGKQIAIVRNVEFGEFLCNAANLFVLAQLKHEADGTQMQVVQKPIIIPGPGAN